VALQEPTLDQAAAEVIRRRQARENFSDFMTYMHGKSPPRHMEFLCNKLQDKMTRKGDRLLVCFPPGHGKSTVSSLYYPAFYLSRNPTHNIITVSHTESFAEQWGRKVRNIMLSDEYKMLFPEIEVSDDSRSAGRWDLKQGGSYYATGVGGTVTGRRADMVICDDLLKGVDDAESQLVRDNMWDWWGSDLSTRLKPSGVMVIIGTRWHLDDIIGRVIAAEKQKGGDKWDKVILPALAKEKDPLGRKAGEALWPEWESEIALARRRAQPSMTARQWESLYQQSPVLESGNVIKRDWIKIWNQREPPKCEFILQSWDTAITSKNKSAYSVCLTFGIFTEDKTDLPSIILLSRWRGRVDYPDLRKMAQRLATHYLDDNREVPRMGNQRKPPDMILIEAKATGEPLIADLNRAGIAATRFNPNKHGDKNARLLLTTDIFENGRFYVPGQPPNYTLPRRWAEEYVNSLMSFPASDSRDDADATSQAIIRMKTSGWIKNSLDAMEEEPFRVTERANGALYG
jgi:predicted phage terminase large subunit-like protein